jgi:protein-S-isoprenylcysteine O-methyltransferase Ste14
VTVSASTPRLRLTLAWYIALIVLVAISARPCASGWLGALADVAGFLLIAGAALGRIWTSLYIAGLKDAQLVTSGPYAACRNPLYFFSLVGGTGIGLVTGSLVLTGATLVVLFVLYAQAMRAEERFLADRHGEEFRRYCASVPRLVPSWTREAPPEKIEVNARVFAKAFVDAGSFFLLFALLELADALRAAGALPTLLTLW